MPSSWKLLGLPFAGVIFLVGGVVLLTPSPAEAQCGSQASSCKNCHEAQAQDPVNAEGDWHISHAFGDFCEFCHSGNVQAIDADTAHQGMVQPLADPVTSCAACHPTDMLQLAQVYGTALGIEVGSVGSAPPADVTAVSPSTIADPALVAAATPLSADLIDYNTQYAQTVEERAQGEAGNLILGLLIALIALGGGGYVLRNELRRRASASPAPAASPPPAAPADETASEARDLLTAVEALDPHGRRGLELLLRDPVSASQLLRRLAGLDPDLIRRVRGLDRETRALLLALTSDE
jgi:hypothetical protein